MINERKLTGIPPTSNTASDSQIQLHIYIQFIILVDLPNKMDQQSVRTCVRACMYVCHGVHVSL